MIESDLQILPWHIGYGKNVSSNFIKYLKEWKNKGSFDNLNDIGECINLVQLLDTFGNARSDVSIFVTWIFDSKF